MFALQEGPSAHLESATVGRGVNFPYKTTGQGEYHEYKVLFRTLVYHMISSAIWDKSARVNFSKANQIARARRASAICSL